MTTKPTKLVLANAVINRIKRYKLILNIAILAKGILDFLEFVKSTKSI
jgi:hypothetical protein